MKKLVTVAALATAVAAITGGASAGPATTDANGNVSVVDIGLWPPVAGARATVTFQEFFGNREGRELPRVETTTIELPRGLRGNGRRFPKCYLPDTPDEVGTKRCRRSQRVGGGTVEADARPAVAEPLAGELTAYNGELRDGNPTLILLADVVVGGTTVTGELDFELDGSTLRQLPQPPGTPSGGYVITKVDARFGKTISVRRRGRRVRVGLIQNPRVCRGGTWKSRSTQIFAGGGSIVATDTTPCVPRR